MITGTIIGNLGRDAEVKQVGQSSAVEFSVASTQKSKGEDRTTWVRVTLWGKTGERVAQYLSKGTQVAVSGELTLREYQKRDGAAGVSLEMNGDRIKLLGKREGGQGRDARPAPSPSASSGGGGYSDADYGSDTPDDDIPFALNVTSDPRERWWAR